MFKLMQGNFYPLSTLRGNAKGARKDPITVRILAHILRILFIDGLAAVLIGIDAGRLRAWYIAIY